MYQALRENEAMKATGGLPFKLGQVVPCTHPSYINCCSRATKAPKKLAAEGIFDEVGTPTFAIDVISQHDMAFALRSLANPAYAELMVTNMAVRTHASRRLQPSCPPLWRPMSEDDLVDSRTSWAGARVRAGPVVCAVCMAVWVGLCGCLAGKEENRTTFLNLPLFSFSIFGLFFTF